MQIRRDYSQPFFSDRRRRRGRGFWLLVFFMGALVGGGLAYIDSNFFQLQNAALHAIGQGPAPTPFASNWAEEGYNRFMAGDMEQAAEMFGSAVRLQPTNVDYLYEYGRALLELARFEEAIAIGDQAINANPRDPRGYAIKARALDLNDQSEAAIPVGQQGLQVRADFAPIHAALASAYRNIDRYDVALDYAEQAIELDPLDANARRIYALNLMWVGRRDEAIEQLEEAIAINPNLTAPYFELAVLYRSQNEFELAVATYETVLTIDPGNPRANLRLCQVYIQIGQDSRAEGYCEDALFNDPNYAEAMSTLGWVMYRRRNYEGAIEQFRTCEQRLSAVAAQPGRVTVSETGASLLMQVGALSAEEPGYTIHVDDLNEDTIRCFYMRGLAHYYLGECDASWTLLNDSLDMTTGLPQYVADTVGSQIGDGLSGVTARCTGYIGRALPTAIPPTAIPPTPIGG